MDSSIKIHMYVTPDGLLASQIGKKFTGYAHDSPVRPRDASIHIEVPAPYIYEIMHDDLIYIVVPKI